jgi:hypothetical protein
LKKQLIPYFISITIAITSCGQNSFEKELNGNWYELKNNGFTRMLFESDSLTITDWSNQTIKWKANKEQIEFNYKLLFPDSNGKQIQETVLSYKLEPISETLKINFIKPDTLAPTEFIRADNYIDYLNKKNKIQFSLPTDSTSEFIEINGDFGLKVFIGFENGKLTSKTEFSDNLKTLSQDIEEFKNQIKLRDKFYEEMLPYRLHYRVFADKGISTSNFRMFIDSLKESTIKKVYRMYESEEIDNLDYMKGKRIKTIVNNLSN